MKGRGERQALDAAHDDVGDEQQPPSARYAGQNSRSRVAARLRGGSVRSSSLRWVSFSTGPGGDGRGSPTRGEENGARGALLVLGINLVAVTVCAAQAPSQSDRSAAIAVAAVKASAEASAIAEPAAIAEAAPGKAMPAETVPAKAMPAKAASTTAEVPAAAMTTAAMTAAAMTTATVAAATSIGGGGECDCSERECRRRFDDEDFNTHSHAALLAMCSNERTRRSFYARVESSRMTFEQVGDAPDSLHFQQCLDASRDAEPMPSSLRPSRGIRAEHRAGM